jgi:hypothetical protein
LYDVGADEADVVAAEADIVAAEADPARGTIAAVPRPATAAVTAPRRAIVLFIVIPFPLLGLF